MIAYTLAQIHILFHLQRETDNPRRFRIKNTNKVAK